MKIQFSAGAPRLSTGLSTSEFEVAAQQTLTATGSGGSTVTIDDRVYTRLVDATHYYKLKVTPVKPSGGVVFSSLTPDVCTIPSSGGDTTLVSNGVCKILATGPLGAVAQQQFVASDVAEVSTGIVDIVQPMTGATGSLRHHVATTIAAAIAGKTPGAGTQDTHTAIDVLGGSASINPNLFLPLNFSFATIKSQQVYPNGALDRMACYFVSPRHALFSSHTWGAYNRVWLRRNDGTVIEARATHKLDMGGDVSLAYFDRDVTGIDYATLAPISINSQLPGLYKANGVVPWPLSYVEALPVLSLRLRESSYYGSTPVGTMINTDSRHLRITQIYYISQQGSVLNVAGVAVPYASTAPTTPAELTVPELDPWTANVETGDSSSGMFLPVNGVPVLVQLQFGSGGPWLPNFSPAMNAAMNAVAVTAGESSPNYQAQFADLSGFTSF